MEAINEKMYSFLLKDKLNLSIYDMCRYIEENYPSVDIYNIKKNYVHIQPNNNKIDDMLISYICHEIYNILEDEMEEDIETLVRDNLQIFFEITDKEDGIVIVEDAKCD